MYAVRPIQGAGYYQAASNNIKEIKVRYANFDSS